MPCAAAAAVPPRPPLSPPTGYVFVISGTRCAAGSVSCWRYSHVIHVKLIHDSRYSTCQSQKRTAIATAEAAEETTTTTNTTTRTLVVEEKLPGKCHAHNLLKDSRKCWTNNVCRWNLFAFIIELENCKTKLPNWQSMGRWEIGRKFANNLEKCVTWQSNRAIDEEESFIIFFSLNVKHSERVHWIINLYSATPATIPSPLDAWPPAVVATRVRQSTRHNLKGH